MLRFSLVFVVMAVSMASSSAQDRHRRDLIDLNFFTSTETRITVSTLKIYPTCLLPNDLSPCPVRKRSLSFRQPVHVAPLVVTPVPSITPSVMTGELYIFESSGGLGIARRIEDDGRGIAFFQTVTTTITSVETTTLASPVVTISYGACIPHDAKTATACPAAKVT